GNAGVARCCNSSGLSNAPSEAELMLATRQADVVRELIKARSDPAGGRPQRKAAGDIETHSIRIVVVYIRAQLRKVKSIICRSGILPDFGNRETEGIDCGGAEQIR